MNLLPEDRPRPSADPFGFPASARAWLYGKMLVALLTEKLIAYAKSISPWGYQLQAISPTQPLA
jgi:hypothetical protein